MKKVETFQNGLTCWKFLEDDKEIGEMKISFYEDEASVFSILSLKKGMGTWMIHHLKALPHIKLITGDVSEGTDAFWISLGAEIEKDSFSIPC